MSSHAAVARYAVLSSCGYVVATFFSFNSEYRMPVPTLFNALHVGIACVVVNIIHALRGTRSYGPSRPSLLALSAVLVNAALVYLDLLMLASVEPHVTHLGRVAVGSLLWAHYLLDRSAGITRQITAIIGLVVGIGAGYQTWQKSYWTQDFLVSFGSAALRAVWTWLHFKIATSPTKKSPDRFERNLRFHLNASFVIHIFVLFFFSRDIGHCRRYDFFSRYFDEPGFWAETAIFSVYNLVNLVLTLDMAGTTAPEISYAAFLGKTLLLVPTLIKTIFPRPP